jgi:hypothetical protein
MNTLAINEALKPPRMSSLAIISGTLLCAASVVGPALSADLPYDDTPYRPGYYRNDYNNSNDTGYNSGCYRCSCCGRRLVRVAEPPPSEERAPVPYAERPPEGPFLVAERAWVRGYKIIEQRYYEPYYKTLYSYPPYPAYPRRDRYSNYYPGRGAGPYDAAPPGEPRRERRLGFGGVEYPPAPAAYEYQPEPRAPYRYVTSSRAYDYRPAYEYGYRPSHEYEAPRPPSPVPSGYYGPGYSE